MSENLVLAIEFVMIVTGCLGWVVSTLGESVNEFKGNLDHYLRDKMGFKYLLEPSALSSGLLAEVLGKL